MKAFIDSSLLIYLNTLRSEHRAVYESFYLNLLSTHKAYVDVLVLDELLYVSKKKYNVPYGLTSSFIESIVLPCLEVLPLGEEEYVEASKILTDYNLKPSDALHVAAMTTNGISVIASEDEEMGRVRGIRRIWT